MAPKKKSAKSLKSGKSKSKVFAVDYFDATFTKLFSDIAERLNDAEAQRRKAGEIIVPFLKGHVSRRDVTPQLAPTRQVIYARLKAELKVKRENDSATVIQTKWRSHKERSKFKSEHTQKREAAITIQKTFRGSSSRKKLKAKREDDAARLIQRVERGRIARKTFRELHSVYMAELRLAASITIQRFARGLMVRRWYVKHFDQRACCTCNSLADTEVIVCSDCYEVYHLKCAGYKPDQRPANNKPWFCHFCVANKAQHTVFVRRRRAAVAQSMVRLHVNSEEDIDRLYGISSEPLSKTIATARANALAASFTGQDGPGELKKYTNKLNESMSAQDRLAKARQRMEDLQVYGGKIREKVSSLKAEARGEYNGAPPARTTTSIPTVPVLNKDQPLTLLPEGPQDGRGSAESAMSRRSLGAASQRSFGASSQRSFGGMSRKSGMTAKSGRSGKSGGGRKKRPLSKRLSNPLHDRNPKFPAYMETREEQFQGGTRTHTNVMTMRASWEKWGKSPFGLNALDILTDPVEMRDIHTLLEDPTEGMEDADIM